MPYSYQQKTDGNYEVFQNGNRVATGTQAVLANYGLSLPADAQSVATSVPLKIDAPAKAPAYVSSGDVTGQFQEDKKFIDSRMTGSIPPGWDAATYANFKKANPTLEPNSQDTAMMKAAGQKNVTNTPSQEQSGNLATYQDRLAAGQGKFDAQLQTETNDANARLKSTLDTLGTSYSATKASITSQYADLIKKTQRLQSLDIGRRNAYGLSSAVYDPMGHTDSVTQATDEWNAEIAKYNTERDIALQNAQVAYEQGKAGALAASRKEIQDVEDRIRTSTKDFQEKLSDQLKNANDAIKLKYQEFDERGKLASQKALVELASYKAAKTPEERNKIIADAIYAVGGDPNNAAEYAAVKTALDGKVTEDAKLEYDKKKQALDLRQGEASIQHMANQDALDLAKLHLEQSKVDAEKAGISDPSQLIAYAQQYASTGTIPTGLPKGSFGMVAQFAKEAPKPSGTLVDRNTGIKSGTLSSSQEDGIIAMRDLTSKLGDLKTLFNGYNHGVLAGTINAILPSQEQQQYQNLRSEVVDLLARARSGAALTADEVRTYKNKLPGDFNKSLFLGSSGNTSIDSLKGSIQGKLDTTLKTQGLSIYGYSTIKQGDTEYKVGDTIEVNGKKGRVLPDGTIAELPSN